MRLFLVALPLGVLVAGAATGPPKQGALRDLRVCGNNVVRFSGSQCARDERSTPLRAGELDCSVSLAVRRPTFFRAAITYNGALQYDYTEVVKPGTRRRVIGVYMHNTQMPAGSYACRFDLGSRHLGATFRSAGPSGNLLGPAACLGAHSVNESECPHDESASPLPPTNSVSCSAVFARKSGRTAQIALLDPDGSVLQSHSVALHYPITEAGATFTASSGTFAAGSYSCRFSVAGQQANRPFRISG